MDDLPLVRLAHVDQRHVLAGVDQIRQLARRERDLRRELGNIGRDAAERLVVDELRHGRVLPADRALGVFPHFQLAELQLERVVDQHPADHRIAGTGYELDGFGRLQRTDRPAEHAEHAALGARRDHPGRRRLGEQAAIARSVLRPEHRQLSVEPVDRSPHVRLAEQHARVVHEVPRGEVVRSVDDQVVAAEEVERVLRRDEGLVLDHVDERVDLLDRVFRAVELLPADVRLAVHDLTLEVRLVHHVVVDEAEGSHACRREVHRDR